MVEISADISDRFGIHDINVLVVTEIFSRGLECGWPRLNLLNKTCPVSTKYNMDRYTV